MPEVCRPMPITQTLQEVVLVEHFWAPLPLTVLDLAAWAQAFDRYKESHQLQPAAPIDLSAHPANVQFSIAPAIQLPRLLLRTVEGGRTVQFQADRFAVGWQRETPIGEPADYPGYEALRATWLDESARFHTWCQQRLGQVPSIRLVELGYNNAAPMVVGDQRRRLSEIFRWVVPGRAVNGFQVAWQEVFGKDRPDAARVAGLVALGAAPPVAEALIFNFTGFGPVDGRGDNPVAMGMFDALHERTLDMYSAAIISGGEKTT
jgi:hypothetical protein